MIENECHTQVLEKIDSLTKLVRNAWLTLLLINFFSIFTVGRLSDSDKVISEGIIKVPIIGIEIVPYEFIILSPLLIIVFYVYFHILVARLMKLYTKLPSHLNTHPKREVVSPWLMTDVIDYRRKNSSPLAAIGLVSSILLGWIFPVASIAYIGGGHVVTDPFIEFWQALLLTIAIFVALPSARYTFFQAQR